MEVAIGETWRDPESGLLYKIVALEPGWVWVRLAMHKHQPPNQVNPAWFSHWDLVRKSNGERVK